MEVQRVSSSTSQENICTYILQGKFVYPTPLNSSTFLLNGTAAQYIHKIQLPSIASAF
jgi:hypothetical protein